MKRNSSLKLVLVLLLFTGMISLAGCTQKETVQEPKTVFIPEVTVFSVVTGLSQEFTATGDVSADQTSNLTSEIRGKVDSILFREGGEVKKGDTIITLTSSELDSAFSTASNTLNNAKVSLQSTQITAQNNIEAAEISLGTARSNLQNTIQQNAALKKQAEEALNSAKLSVGLAVTSSQKSLDNTIKNVLPTVLSAITATDKILGVSESYKYTNDLFENNLGALDRIAKSEAEKALRQLISDTAAYDNSLINAESLLRKAEDMLQKTLTVLNASITGNTYSELALTTDTSSITAQLSAVRGSITGLDNAVNALKSAEQETSGQSQSVVSAQAVYNSTLIQLKSAEDSARRAVASAEKAVEAAKQSSSMSRITAKSTVDNAYGSYDQARISKNKLVIQAPFDGKISQLPIDKGQEVNPGTLLAVIEDDSQLVISVYLSQSDVEKINLGDTVSIAKIGETATISTISPGADPITKKYKVDLKLSQSKLNPGESVRVTFKTGSEVFNHGRLFVPLPALHIEPNELFVWKVVNRKTVKLIVKTGELVGDYVEITEGLSEGDEIISEGGRLIEDEGVQVSVSNRPSPKVPQS